MKNLDIDLVDHHEASVESSGDGYVYVTVDAEFGLIPDNPIYIEYQLVCIKDDIVVSSSNPSSTELTFESPRVYITESFHAGQDQIPDSFKINFRVFVPDEPVVIDTPIPPEITRQSGAFLIHSPKKGLLSREKWASGGVTAESIVVKNVAGEDDELFVNLTAKNHTQSGFLVICASEDDRAYTIFKIIDKPQVTSDQLRLHLRKDLQVTLVGYEAGDWRATEFLPFTDFKKAEEASGSLESDALICRLYIRGNGFEIQGASLSEEDVSSMKTFHETYGEDLFAGGRLAENASVGEPLFDDCYGPDPFDSSFTWEDSSEDPGINETNFNEIELFVDFENHKQGFVEYYGVAYGKIFGCAQIPVTDPSEFDPAKLKIDYFRFVLDGWPELHGSIIKQITYDGSDVELEFEDNGLDVDTFLLGHEYQDDEILDGVVLHESRASQNQTIEWSKLAQIYPVKEPQKTSTPRNQISESATRLKAAPESEISGWHNAVTPSDISNTKEFPMAIKQFESEAPDDDGDISIDIAFEVKNESGKDVSLVKWDLLLEQDGAPLDGSMRNSEECLLDKGDVYDGSAWLRINQRLIDPSAQDVTVKVFAKMYEREFFKLGEIVLPEEANTPVSLAAKIDSSLLESDVVVSLIRIPDDNDENAKEHSIDLKTLITNKSDEYAEEVELKVVLFDRSGAEEDDSRDLVEVLGPHSGTMFQPSFWSKPKSKLKGSKVELSLKVYRLVGTQVLVESKKLSD